MFWKRLISGAVLLALMIVLNILGGPVQLVALCAVSLVGMFELCRIFDVEKRLPGFLAYAACMLYYADLYLAFLPERTMVFIVFLILLLTVFVLAYPAYHTHQILAAFFSLFYVAVMLAFVWRVRAMENGLVTVWLVFLSSWGCDTCAYCVGMLIGRHQMSPKLSPKKSVEGAVGGVAGAVLLTVLVAKLFALPMADTPAGLAVLCVTAGLAALISMVGDLAASAIKRNFDIKDYGRLIPGHGGVLDRFDSVIITAPVIYYLLLHLGG